MCFLLDTHGLVKDNYEIPPGDVLLHAGDFSNVGLPRDIDKFVAFITSKPHPHKVRMYIA